MAIQKGNTTLITIVLAVLMPFLGLVSGYAVSTYRVNEQATQIKELKDNTVSRSEWESLNKRLDRIENKIESVDGHIIQHMQQSVQK